MIIKNAFYPHSMPTKIVVELPDGTFRSAELAPFREIADDELTPLAFFAPVMGDEIPDHTLRFYGLKKEGTMKTTPRFTIEIEGLNAARDAGYTWDETVEDERDDELWRRLRVERGENFLSRQKDAFYDLAGSLYRGSDGHAYAVWMVYVDDDFRPLYWHRLKTED